MYRSNHSKKKRVSERKNFILIFWSGYSPKTKKKFLLFFSYFKIIFDGEFRLFVVIICGRRVEVSNILMWCLVMWSYIHIFLCRQSLRKKFHSPTRDIICTHQIMVASSTHIWTYEVLSCVKLNENIRAFLSYSITLNIYIYIYSFHQITPVQ
jgi:hypothetical protein